MRRVLAAVAGILIAMLLFYVGTWLQLWLSSFGAFARSANQTTISEAFKSFGDPTPLLSRFLLINLWLVGPVASAVAAVTARIINRRTTWTMCIIVALPISAIPLLAALGVETIAAASVYILAAYGSMKAVDLSSPRVT